MPRAEKHCQIVEKLAAGEKPKVISHLLNVPYQSVVTLKNRLFDVVLVRKDNHDGNPDQMNFFRYW